MQKPKIDKRGENLYGNYDRNADGMWKRGLDSSMVMWNTNVPYEDTTSYVDESYFDSEIGYLSCYSDSKNPFHTNPNCGVHSAPPNSVGIPLSFGGVRNSTYPWLQHCPLCHVIRFTGCGDMINAKQQYHGKGF